MSIKLKVGRGQNVYTPMFPQKYKGRYPIVSRSSWELQFMKWCDANPNILEWSSESIKIPYLDPVKGRRRRYYPDFWVKVKDKDGNVVKYIVEIKPHKESIPPKPRGKTNKTRRYEMKAYATNQAKWKAAKDYCRRMGLRFKVLTEKELFGK